MTELVLPSIRYKESYIEAVRAYKAEGIERYKDLDPQWLEEHFVEFVEQLAMEAAGKGLPPGRVPHTEFWLVDDEQFIGRLDIRHELNDYLHHVGGHIGYDVRSDQRGKGYGKLILELGLQKAKDLGLENVLITCDATNIPSKKVIEANGGVLENVVKQEAGKPDKNRYWIQVQ